jgi:protein-S-isoprenylcysteine O-methyltransferase Ste14
MLWLYESFFPVIWIAFLIYWRIKAVDTKTTQRLEPAASGILRLLAILIAVVLLSTTRIPVRWLYIQLWPAGFWPFWLGAAVTVAGLLFAIWARVHLGRNWSSSVTIKEDHELITSGPYAMARHPIYTAFSPDSWAL